MGAVIAARAMAALSQTPIGGYEEAFGADSAVKLAELTAPCLALDHQHLLLGIGVPAQDVSDRPLGPHAVRD